MSLVIVRLSPVVEDKKGIKGSQHCLEKRPHHEGGRGQAQVHRTHAGQGGQHLPSPIVMGLASPQWRGLLQLALVCSVLSCVNKNSGNKETQPICNLVRMNAQ